MKSRIIFKSFCSGSCGNCYLLGIDEGKGKSICVLIDAGTSPRRLKPFLAGEGLNIDDIRGILVTHDHMDHIRCLGSYCKRFPFPVFTTPTLHNALNRNTKTRDHINTTCREMDEGWNVIVEGRIKAKYFVVPHDATQTVGYAIMLDGFKFVIMTDIGRMTREGLDFASQADTVVIESNYDLEMLRNGPYPVELQDRICLGNGHLSNVQCSDAIREFIHPGLGYIFLCHLSEHNNTPGKALEANRKAVSDPTRLIALPRTTPSPLFTLRDGEVCSLE